MYSTPKLKKCWRQGVEAFLFFGEFTAHRVDKTPLTESDRIFIRMNKKEIIAEIKSIPDGVRISFDKFLLDRGL